VEEQPIALKKADVTIMSPLPVIAPCLKREKWIHSLKKTREIDMSPYNLQHYIREVDGTHVEDYVVLSHSGYGVNSYALQYYLVHGMLEMFLHLS
jgi:hypothetical protein